MCENIAGQGFISFFYAVISPARKRMTYCNAGHNPPILASRDKGERALDCGGGVLGVIADWKYEEQEIRLNSGDRLLLYTDGIIECRNSSDHEFGSEVLTKVVGGFQHGGAASLTDAAVRAARDFSNGNFEDDLTVLAVTVN